MQQASRVFRGRHALTSGGRSFSWKSSKNHFQETQMFNQWLLFFPIELLLEKKKEKENKLNAEVSQIDPQCVRNNWTCR